MNKKSLHTLEYDKIIDIIASFAASNGGKGLVKQLLPSTDIDEINRNLLQTNDAMNYIYSKGSISFGNTKDIGASIKRLEIGSNLSILELLAISNTLDTAARVKNYGRKDTEQSTSLDDLFNMLEPLSNLNSEIKRCIVSEEEISDEASLNLKNIRRQIRITNDRIHTELNAIINSSTMRTYLQDCVITSRNGRYCVPVKAEYKSMVTGMVHDQSSTGSTFFIEPMAIVRLNNELRELALKEQAEIDVILSNLSLMAAEYCLELSNTLKALYELDFIFAKGLFSKQYNCSMPIMNENGYINIKKGRHPLIDSRIIVPIDVYLGDEFDTLIITGPNTGGKTVTLKTVGLLTLMGQAGLCIPAFDGSSLAVFNNVFADIGDEQSIEQSLSTFSSHMTNIVNILKHADEKSLVLFDELCAGTDPTEGAALAISIIDKLHSRHIRTVATTHYSEIKVYALSEPMVANACCEFDVETLSPTYRLLIGIPGKSNAFAISYKLGLTSDIIEAAKSRIGSDEQAFEDLLSDLERSRITIEKEQEEIRAYKEEIEKLKARLIEKNDKLDERKDRIIREANEEAAKILREAKEFADESIKTFNKSGLSPQEMEEQRKLVREKKNKAEAKLALKNASKPKGSYKPSDFTIGTKVKVLSLNLTGTVSTLPNSKGELFVQMGILRSQVNIKDLDIIDEPDIMVNNQNIKSSTSKIKMSKTLLVSPEINLIGLTVDEALCELDKYLDDAYISKIASVRVVHGKGTGALRNAVHAKLKKTSYVANYRLGAYGEGDHGVTIVEFK